LAEIKDALSSVDTPVLFVSAATKEGVSELMAETGKTLQVVNRLKQEAGEKIPQKIFRPQPRGVSISVHKEDDTFVVVAPGLERIVARTNAAGAELHWQLRRQLARAGVTKALERAGVKPGDRVRCGNLEWEW